LSRRLAKLEHFGVRFAILPFTGYPAMAGKHRIHCPGTVCHVILRGNVGYPVLFEDRPLPDLPEIAVRS
jgi:hypothetical protein